MLARALSGPVAGGVLAAATKRASHLPWAPAAVIPARFMGGGSRPNFKTTGTKNASKQPVSEYAPHRLHLGLFGVMNAGKSSIVNMITQSTISIVDDTPGTTCDIKAATMEVHELGPIKLFDTPGLDEGSALGSKKRAVTYGLLKEVDVCLVVINPIEKGYDLMSGKVDEKLFAEKIKARLEHEAGLIRVAKHQNVETHVLFNTHDAKKRMGSAGFTEDQLLSVKVAILRDLGLEFHDSFNVHLEHPGETESSKRSSPDRHALLEYIRDRYREHVVEVPVLPPQYLEADSEVFMNIPMDIQTPSGRLLRPQAMVQEACLRNFVSTTAFRMNLDAARGTDEAAKKAEEGRFRAALDRFLNSPNRKGSRLLVTDSQAMDIISKWTLNEKTGEPLCDITTFSVTMIHYMSKGNLQVFVDGLRRMQHLREDDHVLMLESCNHTRITDQCDDIGMVQIPKGITKRYGVKPEHFAHAFGRGFEPSDMEQYALAVHCGACMMDAQKLMARIRECQEAGVPITNYGLVLSYFQSVSALKRVLKPFGLDGQVDDSL